MQTAMSEQKNAEESTAMHMGYSVELFVERDKVDDFICAICTDVCRDAMETNCAHIFCAACLATALEVKAECPVDRHVLNADEVRPAGFVRRKVQSLGVKCPNFASGCQFRCELRDLDAHAAACPYTTAQCRSCRDIVQLKDLEHHIKNECQCRQVRCEFCAATISFDELKTHHSLYCLEHPLPCPNDCGAPVQPRRQLNKHLTEACPLQEVKCRYARHGCGVRVLRSHLDKHLRESYKEHLDLVEASHSRELDAVRKESMELVRFVMQVGNMEQFLKLLASVHIKSPVEHAETIVRGMKIFSGDPFVQERACFALITLCEVNNKNADANIAAVVNQGGINAIIDAMKNHPEALKVQEYALHVLRKMATNIDVKNFVQRGNTDCIAQILRTMEIHQGSVSIQRDAIGVLLNMAVNDTIESRIGEQGGIEHILAAMDRYPNSTSLEQLACHALFHLTFDDRNKERLVSAGALVRLIAALKAHSSHINTVYYSLRAMAQLAKIDRYRDKMKRYGLVELAQKALYSHPSHKDLQKKVKALLSRLGTDS